MRFLTGVLIAACLPVLAADKDFNGRWNITVPDESRSRAWWLEINGAGTAGLNGKFVGAPGGNMDVIPELSIRNGDLVFVFQRRMGPDREAKPSRLVYRARVVKGRLEGSFQIEGSSRPPLKWFGKRAPVIKDRDDGTWVEAQPVALFNGRDLSGWLPMVKGRELGWTVQDGLMTNVAGANNLVSERRFWNFILKADYRVGPRSNSGIGLRGRYEIQVLEDYGKPPDTHSSGALYSRIPPSENASRPADQWQSFEIRLVGRQVTVVQNGRKVIDKGEVEGLTAMAHDPDEAEPGPISLQGDHGKIEFRSLVVIPLVKKK